MSEGVVLWLFLCGCISLVMAVLGWPMWAMAVVWAGLGLFMLAADK